MVFDLIPVRPNPREDYQKRVEKLCNLLKDEDGSTYRVDVFTLLTISGTTFSKKPFIKFRKHPQAEWFLSVYHSDVRALEIMDELDKIYGADPGEIDHLRGAVGEVFSFFICRKVYPKAGMEVKIRIGTWTSGLIDAAGCSQKRGHCLQSKASLRYWNSIFSQKKDLDRIEKLTAGKAQGAFITYENREVFYRRLRNAGFNPSEYKVLDRWDLSALEKRLVAT